MSDALLVTSSFLPGRGGIESYLAELCALLAPRLSVLAPARRDGVSLPTDLPYRATGYPGSMLLPHKGVADGVVEAARAEGTDRVVFGTPWPLALLGPRLQAAGLRYAVIVHGAEFLVPAAVPGVRNRLITALAGAELLLPVSEFTADALGRAFARSGRAQPPTRLLRARVDLQRFHPEAPAGEALARLSIPSDRPFVLCFGRLVKRKGVHRLLDAWPLIAREVPGALAVVAGTGPELRSLMRRAQRKAPETIFTGRVPDELAPALYAAATVFALPVTDRWFGLEVEGLGVVLLEAAAAGSACVTGRSGGTPEAVIDGRSGFVVDANDPLALSGPIVELLSDTAAADRMGRAGREHVAEEFSAEKATRPLAEWLS